VIVDMVLATIIVVLAVCYRLSMRQHEKKMTELMAQLNKAQKEKNQQLEDQLSLISKGSLGVGRRLMSAEKKLNQAVERVYEIENHDADQLSFDQAAKLLEKGIELNEVVGKVGITRSEANLVNLFQQKELETLD